MKAPATHAQETQMRALPKLIFVTLITLAFTAVSARAQTPQQVEAWKAQSHCHWKDSDGRIRSHPVLAFADARGVAVVDGAPIQTGTPYFAVCTNYLFPRGKQDCAQGGCYKEATRPSKDCKGEVPMPVKGGIHFSSGCLHVAKKKW